MTEARSNNERGVHRRHTFIQGDEGNTPTEEAEFEWTLKKRHLLVMMAVEEGSRQGECE